MNDFISVIIPTYNRPESLDRCLNALSQSNYPRNQFEVVVVDDGGDLSLECVVSKYKDSITLQLLRQNNAGPAAARNYGALHAQGDIFAFTDDDCLPDPNWLPKLQQHFKDHGKFLVGGHTVNILSKNIYSSASQLLIDYIYEYFNKETPTFFTSNNIAITKTDYQKLQGFDETFPLAAAEDRDFCDRVLCYGMNLLYEPQAIIYHSHTLDLRKFLRQHFNYGRGAYFFQKRRLKRRNNKLRFEPLKFYFNLISYPLKHSPKIYAFPQCCLMFGSQVANAMGFFFQKWKSK